MTRGYLSHLWDVSHPSPPHMLTPLLQNHPEPSSRWNPHSCLLWGLITLSPCRSDLISPRPSAQAHVPSLLQTWDHQGSLSSVPPSPCSPVWEPGNTDPFLEWERMFARGAFPHSFPIPISTYTSSQCSSLLISPSLYWKCLPLSQPLAFVTCLYMERLNI